MSTEPQLTPLRILSATAFVPPDEREEYEDFCADYLRELAPKTAVEDTLADEIIQAAWRLRRCAAAEQQEIPVDVDPGQLERLQASIDRARATAQRVYHKSLTEFRRVQSERRRQQIEKEKVGLDNTVNDVLRRGREIYAEVQRDFAKRSQSPAAPQSLPAEQASIPDTRIPSASAFPPAFAKQSQSAPGLT